MASAPGINIASAEVILDAKAGAFWVLKAGGMYLVRRKRVSVDDAMHICIEFIFVALKPFGVWRIASAFFERAESSRCCALFTPDTNQERSRILGCC
jgi:hypothetical protein